MRERKGGGGRGSEIKGGRVTVGGKKEESFVPSPEGSRESNRSSQRERKKRGGEGEGGERERGGGIGAMYSAILSQNVIA